MAQKKPIPIIDLFAGPGGLGEGFSSLERRDGRRAFRIGLSIEKDPVAHRTLTLRSVFRQLRETPHRERYFDYARGRLSETDFKNIPAVALAYEVASKEARCLELGKDKACDIDEAITEALDGSKHWLLIGGPPCQAYSVAGRARRTNDVAFEDDVKHFLYREYLRIIKVHKPAAFVMENVKGMLTSKHGGAYMFQRILADLAKPERGLEYEIRSFVKHTGELGLNGEDYIIEAEKFGIPQARHRVILLGVRKGLGIPEHSILNEIAKPFSVKQAIGDLPKLRSQLSSRKASDDDWDSFVLGAAKKVTAWAKRRESSVLQDMVDAARVAVTRKGTGSRFLEKIPKGPDVADDVRDWFVKDGPGGVLQHETRSHMGSDLARYLFAACFAAAHKVSPRLDSFPPELLPNHKNAGTVATETVPFMDRFRVQCAHHPSTTVVSHIAKDGHYYIHYDPTQCRALTVREAARLQTFPDNYFFEGNRTQQYTQVGNAVPPLLANKLAKVVADLFEDLP